MKSLLLFFFICFCNSIALSQTFISPTISESIFPNSSTGDVLRPEHSSAYFLENITIGSDLFNLYIYSWSSRGLQSGFAYKKTKIIGSSEITIDSNYISYSYGLYDVEAAPIKDGNGNIVILVSYYKNEISSTLDGHYFEAYYLTGGGLIPFISATQISNSLNYGRISIDAHNLYAISIVWEDSDQLYVKGFDTWSGTFKYSNNIKIDKVYGYIPDIAFSHDTSNLKINIVYIDLITNHPTVVSLDFYNLFLPVTLLPFTIEDINPITFPPPPIGSGYRARFSDNLQIDCPDHFHINTWAYSYTTDYHKVYCRIFNSDISSLPYDFDVSGTGIEPYTNEDIAIHYNRNGFIVFGWHTTFTLPGMLPGYISNQFDYSGNLIGLIYDEYFIISNDINLETSALAFSKRDEGINKLFVSYGNIDSPTSSYDFRTKSVNSLPISTFSSVVNNNDIINENRLIKLYPNPIFDKKINIEYTEDWNDLFRVSVINIKGETMLILNEKNMFQIQNMINYFFRNELSINNNYFINFTRKKDSKSFLIKLIK